MTPNTPDELKDFLIYQADRYFPKGDKSRGKAMMLVALAVGPIERLITEAKQQAVVDFVAQYKAERIGHTLGNNVKDWKRELEHLSEFHDAFQASLKGRE